MRQKTWFLELLGKAIEGREALAAGRTAFVRVESGEADDRCPTGRPGRLIALRDLAPLPTPRPV